MQEKRGIAIFGGSFNPPLNSHITLAKEILKKFKVLEKLIFVPVSTRYQKESLVSDNHRYNMLKLICKKEDKLEVSDVELNLDKQLYTIQTLDIFKNKYKNYDIYFVMGTDNLKELKTWKEAERILSDYKVIVLERNDDNLCEVINKDELLKKYRQALIKIDNIGKIYLSSTMIREKIKNGEDIQQFIDKDVLNYVRQNNLYR